MSRDEHEFIEVRNRRWCVRCDLHQFRDGPGPWVASTKSCPRIYSPASLSQEKVRA